jgi:hypothetical protein
VAFVARRLAPLLFLALLWTPAAHAWSWPVQGPVLQPFSFDPANPYAAGQHRGIDIGAATGATLVAPAGGTVTFAGFVPTSGTSLTIATADGHAVTLTHLGALSVARGATVAEGDAVGAVGPSGTPELDTPYVHLGIRVASDPNGYVDPLGLLPPVAPPPASTTPSPPVPSTSSAPAPAQTTPATPTTASVAPTPVASITTSVPEARVPAVPRAHAPAVPAPVAAVPAARPVALPSRPVQIARPEPVRRHRGLDAPSGVGAIAEGAAGRAHAGWESRPAVAPLPTPAPHRPVPVPAPPRELPASREVRLPAELLALGAATLASVLVGLSVALRRRRHPVASPGLVGLVLPLPLRADGSGGAVVNRRAA